MFKKAYDGGYAIGAFNVNNMEIVQAITEACREEKAPVILQVSKGARAYANHTYLVKLVEAAVIECPEIPIALHLDHGDSFETCKSCIDGGFTSVMIDASSKPFAENIEITRKVVEYAHDHGVVVEAELGALACIDGGFTSVMIDASSKPFAENIEITRKVVEYAHDHGVVVEAELGALAGVEDEVNVSAEDSHYTRPEEVEEFVAKTGCDSLAIAIGTSHGAYKFKPGTNPQLRFDILEEVICASTFWRRSSPSCPASPSSCTVLLPFLRSMWRWSTPSAARCPAPSACPRISCVTLLSWPCAR